MPTAVPTNSTKKEEELDTILTKQYNNNNNGFSIDKDLKQESNDISTENQTYQEHIATYNNTRDDPNTQSLRNPVNALGYLPSNVMDNQPSSRRGSLGVYPQMTGSQMDVIPGLTEVPAILSKANVVFEGNFQDIIENWSEEEKASKRRLVQFWRRHENSTIYCSFRPISPGSKPPNSVIISCIYWEERMEYFITSVDCIHLLESLISVRFTVEEKNRIRRNLEGFRPLTVSKCKPETSEFFKLIMAFPNPKPRNIEKDVKVFHWRVLPFALKKIVSKYASGYTPATSLNVESFNAQVKNNTLTGYSPYYTSAGNNYTVPRSGYQRRYSQPDNLVNLSMYGQSYKFLQQNSQQNAFFNQNQSIPTQNYANGNMGNNNFNLSNPSMPSISERPSYEELNSHYSLQNTNQAFLRRHSLADPYSAQYSKPRNINPLARLSEENMFNASMTQSIDNSNSNLDAMRHPTGLGIVEGNYNFNKNNNNFDSGDLKKGNQG